MSAYMRTLGQCVREMRRARHWTQRELATKAGVSDSTIYRLECGMRHPCSTTLHALFAALGPEELAAWREDPEFYKGPVRGLSWADETLPSWLAWLEEKEEL